MKMFQEHLLDEEHVRGCVSGGYMPQAPPHSLLTHTRAQPCSKDCMLSQQWHQFKEVVDIFREKDKTSKEKSYSEVHDLYTWHTVYARWFSHKLWQEVLHTLGAFNMHASGIACIRNIHHACIKEGESSIMVKCLSTSHISRKLPQVLCQNKILWRKYNSIVWKLEFILCLKSYELKAIYILIF